MDILLDGDFTVTFSLHNFYENKFERKKKPNQSFGSLAETNTT